MTDYISACFSHNICNKRKILLAQSVKISAVKSVNGSFYLSRGGVNTDILSVFFNIVNASYDVVITARGLI